MDQSQFSLQNVFNFQNMRFFALKIKYFLISKKLIDLLFFLEFCLCKNGVRLKFLPCLSFPVFLHLQIEGTVMASWKDEFFSHAESGADCSQFWNRFARTLALISSNQLFTELLNV